MTLLKMEMFKKSIIFLLICSCLGRPQEKEEKPVCPGEDLRVNFEDCLIGLGEEDDKSIDIRTTNFDDEADLVCCPPDKIIQSSPPSNGDKSATCADNPGFQCVLYSECFNNEILSPDGQKVLKVVTKDTTNIRTLEINPKISKCPSDVEVCCKITKSEQLQKDGGPSTPGPILEFPRKENFTSRCGRHNLEGIDIRIVESVEGNGTTQVGEWPHTCILFYSNKSSNLGFSPRTDRAEESSFIGGASLIAPGVVLTAAHKVFDKNPENLSVRCGVWDFKHEDPSRPSQELAVDYITIHPAFYRKLVYNDFALLFMSGEFVLAPHLDTVCLPKTPNDKNNEFDLKACVATGFGKDKQGGQYQRAMKQVELPMVDHKDCENRLKTKQGQSFHLHESFVCAGGSNTGDTCDGDGGGPLVCPAKGSDGDRYIQVGITAWGVKCNTPNIPGVYASIPKGLCFINWAVKCHKELKSRDYTAFVNIESCDDDWIDDEIKRLEEEKLGIEDKVKKAKSGEKVKLEEELQRVKEYLLKAKDLQEECQIR